MIHFACFDSQSAFSRFERAYVPVLHWFWHIDLIKKQLKQISPLNGRTTESIIDRAIIDSMIDRTIDILSSHGRRR